MNQKVQNDIKMVNLMDSKDMINFLFNFFLDSYFFNESFNKSRIYNLEYRKKPAELVRKDLISAMKLPDHETLNRDDYLLILDSWREEWEKGVQVPVNPDSLPHSSVEMISEINNDLPSSSSKEFNLPKEWITV